MNKNKRIAELERTVKSLCDLLGIHVDSVDQDIDSGMTSTYREYATREEINILNNDILMLVDHLKLEFYKQEKKEGIRKQKPGKMDYGSIALKRLIDGVDNMTKKEYDILLKKANKVKDHKGW